MYYIHGDITKLAGKFDVIVHGCNCFHTMGAGVAKAIADKWPEVLEADLATARGEKRKLGTLSMVEYEDLAIVNAYTQYKYGGRGAHADYNAIANAMAHVRKTYTGRMIAMPRIGAGLAGGKWADIKKIILKELSGEDFTFVINEQDIFYDELASIGLDDQHKNIESYKKGAHSLMGMFVGKAMKHARGDVDHVRLSNRIYNTIKDKYV